MPAPVPSIVIDRLGSGSSLVIIDHAEPGTTTH
jgi:hypothetical protein